MRIIGGQYKGRKLNPPQLAPTRPTTDFARESLFNILVNNFDLSEVSFLDLFAGTGAISFEMASRGCNNITLVENFEGCVNFIKKTIAELKTSAIKVQRTDVYKYLETCNETFDIIFADAPYKIPNLNKLPDIILEKKLLKEVFSKINLNNINYYKSKGIFKTVEDNGFVQIAYTVYIENDTIRISYNFMTHSQIIDDFDEYTDYHSENEYMYEWQFKFTSNKLHFIRLAVAG